MSSEKVVRGVTVTGVSIVAAVAAITSYVHMHQLAVDVGEEWRAWIIPLSVDGLLVAASMVMLVRRLARKPAGVLAWTGMILGLLASLAANLAVADWADPVSIAVSGWPPLALAVAFELLVGMLREMRSRSTKGEHSMHTPAEASARRVSTAPTAVPTTKGVDTVDTPGEPQTAEGVSTAETPSEADDDLLAKVRPLVAEGAGRTTVAKKLGISPSKARQLIDAIRSEPSVNGKAVA